ncbi:MAG: class I SAM-dependent methyltransferase [Bacillota bacterium]
MKKVSKNFIKKSFSKAISNYSNATENIGLWNSEKYVFDKYFKKDKNILDIGCGTGRTTFNLYKLGYSNIIGLDLTPSMIKEARNLNEKYNTNIKFVVGDATDLDFKDNSFNYVLFSFNGLMQIPKRNQRIKALKEIKRVLKDKGIFIFTTHDRETNDKYLKFWEKERKIWESNKQDNRLYEFGDKILKSDQEDRDLFIHFPNRKEILNCLDKVGFKLLEDFFRSELFEESQEVKKFSTECRFWIVQK